MKLPDYEQVKQALEITQAAATTSETHALLCGLICAGTTDMLDAQNWVESCTNDRDGKVSEEDSNVLKQLYETTQEMLLAEDFSFDLLLPDDEAPITERAKELGHWCAGFISGIGLAGIKWDQYEQKDALELLHKISDISQIDYEHLDMGDEDEESLIEVIEFLRIAVLTLQLEFAHGQSDADKDEKKDSPYLH